MSAPWSIAVVRVGYVGSQGPELWRAWASRREPVGWHLIAEGAEDVVRAAAARWRAPAARKVAVVVEPVQVGLLGGAL